MEALLYIQIVVRTGSAGVWLVKLVKLIVGNFSREDRMQVILFIGNFLRTSFFLGL